MTVQNDAVEPLPLVVNTLARPFFFLGRRLLSIFREPPSWAEFFSASILILYGVYMIADGRPPEHWRTLDMLTDVFPGWWWAGMALFVGGLQMFGLLYQWKPLRIGSAVGVVLWLSLLVCFSWTSVPGTPLVIFAAGWILPNAFAMVRHFHEW